MIYTELTEKAMRLCFDAHKDQEDKSGIPYVFHPIHLAEQMEEEKTTVVALLHDVVEDTDLSLEDLLEEGFPADVVEAIGLMTHAKGVDYMDYVQEIKKNPLARIVKMADLRHNSDPTRLRDPNEKILEKRRTYREALAFLEAE
jgi:(p)ppGpp synthase/HD superfamily hydrolase